MSPCSRRRARRRRSASTTSACGSTTSTRPRRRSSTRAGPIWPAGRPRRTPSTRRNTATRSASCSISPTRAGPAPSRTWSPSPDRAMSDTARRVIVIGAGPVGLCLALRLAQQGVSVCVVEALGEDNFLEQVPRAGTNHPATLELFDRIGLYKLIEPRGIIAPLFHYWDRHENKLIAEFDHIHLKDDTRFPYVLQCERIKIVEEAMKMAQAQPLIDLRLETTFTSFSHDDDGV